MGNELDFEVTYHDRIEYISQQLILAEGGDNGALNFIEFMWDRDPDLLAEAAKANEEEVWTI